MKLAQQFSIFSLVVLSGIFSSIANAKLNVVASTSDVGGLVATVGGDDINLEVIAKGTQDPHYIEPKPSYMVKVSRADLLVSNGLALETGWLPSLIQGGRNPKVNAGSRGYLDLGESADPMGVAKTAVSRAEGDVHPEGNPHFMVDPVRVSKLAMVVADRLGELDATKKQAFVDRAKAFQKQIETKMPQWQERIKKSGITKTITYHDDLAYFLKRFGIEAVGFLEPKPGIPPTANHILEIIDLVKKDKVGLILVENYFDTKIADRLAQDAPTAKVRVVGIAVGSEPGLKSITDVIDEIVTAIEKK